MYDPIRLTKIVEKVVCKDSSKKYYRFRPAKFYGGIATADCCGCNLRCVYCWSGDKVKTGKIGTFYAAEEVADKLVKIAESKGYSQIRISGGEPTIGKKHLFDVLKNIPEEFSFILETNGILLGYDEDYVKELSKFKNLYVRISLKGCTPQEFSKLTGAKPDAFKLQLQALKNCIEHKIPCHAALMIDLIDKKNLSMLKDALNKIHPRLTDLEYEPLMLYPHVKSKLKKAKII
jgi:uncharacterized Fe-S cluster-containing radical SAM superfamily protein